MLLRSFQSSPGRSTGPARAAPALEERVSTGLGSIHKYPVWDTHLGYPLGFCGGFSKEVIWWRRVFWGIRGGRKEERFVGSENVAGSSHPKERLSGLVVLILPPVSAG